jgi:hypothetical protein
MSAEFNEYKKALIGFCQPSNDPPATFQHVYDWYRARGRDLFKTAFKKETGIALLRKPTADDLVAAALPKTYGDLNAKAKDDAFYRAHAYWFLGEMDGILRSVPRKDDAVGAARAFADVLRFADHVLLDSLVLFDDWGTFRARVPGVYGIGKNISEHLMAFYQGARQTIYGHGAWGLSFADNHSDLATATIRQAVEIRLRRAFGVTARISRLDGSIHPIPLNDLLEAIDLQKAHVKFPIRFENIKRVNAWANIYLHSALKLYAWCPPRVLAFLRVFLLGGKAPGWHHSSKAGVVIDRSAFDAVREFLIVKHQSSAFELDFPGPELCEALIIS